MQLTDAIIPAIIGAITAIFTSLIASWISFRTLKAEFIGKRQLDLIGKQTAACEALWSVLEPGSRSLGKVRVISHKNNKHYVNIAVAEIFYSELIRIFNSPSGLYYSRELRDSLFKLTNFMRDNFLSNSQSEESELAISNNLVKSFQGRLEGLRIAIREEIGTIDLKLTKKSLAKNL
jgi:hypothetical protein